MADTVKHTPGPWLAHGGLRGYKGDVFSPTGKSVQDCHHIARCYAPKPENNPIDDLQVLVVERDAIKVIEANARLIAAAPELLLALQELLEVYSKPDERLCCDGRDCGCMGSTVHQQAEHYARAAIVKATGGQ